MSAQGDVATVTVFVAVSPHDAFVVFTEEIELWWKQGMKFRSGGKRAGQIALECKLGGRLFETFESKGSMHTFDVGKVLAWDPPRTLCLEWRGINFKPEEKTFVDVTFLASGEGTLVTVRHRGWADLRDDHPARHGLHGADFARMIGLWWGELMTSLREHVAGKQP
ncbi:MAG: hypothetical protein JWN04_2030 [Myxococcaceae bacterium]|nr:hypothetical protein [Myxococcaceae bacterium]